MMNAVPEITPTFRLQWEEAQDCYVLLYPEGMVKLSASAGEILKRCDGKRDTQAIIADLEVVFAGDSLAEDVQGFLAQAREHGWLKLKPGGETT